MAKVRAKECKQVYLDVQPKPFCQIAVYICNVCKMMRSASIIVLLFTAWLLACRKDKNAHVRENLLGRWKATENARDNNGNGKLDDGESYPDRLYTTHNLVFTGDGALTLMNDSVISGRRKWELLHDNTYLRIIEPAFNTDFYIEAISSTALKLKDTSGGRTLWFMFSKL